MNRPPEGPPAPDEGLESEPVSDGAGYGQAPSDAVESLPVEGPRRHESRLWLSVAVGGAALVTVGYLSTHAHPAYEGGLYLEMAEVIRRGGWGLPRRVPGYTATGVPFAYPPLVFYAVAGLVAATGADPVALELYLPGLVTVACLLPYWHVARELLPSERQAGLATFLYGVTPAVLQWHLSAGGIVRAPAMFLTLCGLYTGIRLFRDGGRRWAVASTALFGLVVLSHPVYAAFFGLSYLVLFAGLDRSTGGLFRGAAVASGGVGLAAPWWLTVVGRFGPDVFLEVSGTRSAIGGGARRVVERFGSPIAALDPITPVYLAAIGGAAYAAHRRRFLLPAWMVVASYGLGEARFTFVAGSMLSATLVFEVIVPTFEGGVSRRVRPRRLADGGVGLRFTRVAAAVVVVVMVWTGAVGAAYAGSSLDTEYVGGTTMPQTVESADFEAMAWARIDTDADAHFVVIGDAAEWFPYYTERAILLSPWGTEWSSRETFRFHRTRLWAVSACESARCLETALRGVSAGMDYLYVPKRAYTIEGRRYGPPLELLASLRWSPRYDVEYENAGVVVFEVDGSRRAERPGHADVGRT